MENRQNFGGNGVAIEMDGDRGGSDYEKWASLGKEVEFAGNNFYQNFAAERGETAEKAEAATDIEKPEIDQDPGKEKLGNIEGLKAQYQGGVNNFINSLYEGDATARQRDADDYTMSMVLEKVIGAEMQDALIEQHATSGDAAPGADFYQKLSEVLAKSKYAEEIANDPFLRSKRADYLAGRYDLNDDKNDGGDPDKLTESDVVDLLWRMDPDFEKSDEARGLFYDADYYDHVYGEPVQKQGTRQGLYLGTVQNALNSALDNGKIGVSELLSDPFLRKRHAALEYGRDGAGHDRGERLAADEVMRRIDGGYTSSVEFHEFVQEQRARRKEIFSEVNQGEIDRATDEALETIPDRKFRKILKTYEKNVEKGDRLLIKTLLGPMGLASNPPEVKYTHSERGESGAYSYSRHLVEIDSALGEEQGFFKRINVIAHEYWHAHQYRGDNVGAARRDQYLTNYRFYQRPTSDYKGYRAQLLEKEAFLFGNKFESRLKKIAGLADTTPSSGYEPSSEEEAAQGPVYYRDGAAYANRGA